MGPVWGKYLKLELKVLNYFSQLLQVTRQDPNDLAFIRCFQWQSLQLALPHDSRSTD